MKSKIQKLFLDGKNLKLSSIQSISENLSAKLELTRSSLEKIKRNNNFLKKNLNERIIYGINTGFGPMASHLLGKSQLFELQTNLIRSHAMGMGDPIKPDFVLAAMIVRLNTLVKGYSGVSHDLLNKLALLINKRIIPVVPEHGAVGTSGDLVQLAHIALALIGEGSVLYQGKIYQTKTLFKKLGISPYKLQPKEGLALINGTSVMSGIGSLLVLQAEKLINLSLQLGALSLELTNAFFDSIAAELHQLRPHFGQIAAAKILREILKSSDLLRDRENGTSQLKLSEDVQKLPEAIQEVYSLRCIAQIVGPVLDSYEQSKKVLEIEINSVTDNPIINEDTKQFYHGGNFHGEYVAQTLDQLKASLVKLTMLSERRINYFLNPNLNKRFPPFLNLLTPGLTLGLQGLQFVATSTTASSQTLAYPHYIHSIPTNGDNQDIVSMGTDAALLTSKVVENAFIVLTIELVTLSQAVDALGVANRLSPKTKQLYNNTRKLFPKIVEDKFVQDKLQNLLEAVKISFEI